MIGRNGERGSRISALAAQHDDDDDILVHIHTNIFMCTYILSVVPIV